MTVAGAQFLASFFRQLRLFNRKRLTSSRDEAHELELNHAICYSRIEQQNSVLRLTRLLHADSVLRSNGECANKLLRPHWLLCSPKLLPATGLLRLAAAQG